MKKEKSEEKETLEVNKLITKKEKIRRKRNIRS